MRWFRPNGANDTGRSRTLKRYPEQWNIAKINQLDNVLCSWRAGLLDGRFFRTCQIEIDATRQCIPTRVASRPIPCELDFQKYISIFQHNSCSSAFGYPNNRAAILAWEVPLETFERSNSSNSAPISQANRHDASGSTLNECDPASLNTFQRATLRPPARLQSRLNGST